jgi:ElaB/YqjD/DUF883 family membrane-anchored ribosome-binding protein
MTCRTVKAAESGVQPCAVVPEREKEHGSMTENKIQNDVESLKKDMAALREDLKGLTRALVEHGKTEAGETKDRLVSELNKELESAREQGEKAVQSVERQIQERPLISLLVALLLGLVFGKLLDRS